MLTALPLHEVFEQDPLEKKNCAWPECEAISIARGLCSLHYHRFREGRDPDCATQREAALVAWLRLVGTDPEDDQAFQAAWDRVDAAMDRWLEIKLKNREAGRRGAAVRAAQLAAGGER